MPNIVSPAEQGKMEYLGQRFGYQLYRNGEGFIEGYRTIWQRERKTKRYLKVDIERVVTNTPYVEEFYRYIKPLPEQTVIGVEDTNSNQLNLPL